MDARCDVRDFVDTLAFIKREQQPQKGADQLPECFPNMDVRRCADGSIDFDFYRSRAKELRSTAMLQFLRSLRKRTLSFIRLLF